MSRAKSRRVAPSARRDRTSKSIDTERSADSILANLDWLVPNCFANAAWVIFRLWRRRLRLRAKATFISTSVASCFDSPRNSCADPTFHPAAWSRFAFAFFIAGFHSTNFVVLFQSSNAILDNAGWPLLSLLAENLKHHDCIGINPVNNPQRLVLVRNPKFVTSPRHRRHGARMRHPKPFALLKPQQQHACCHSPFFRERRGPYLTGKPDQRLVVQLHFSVICQI